MSHSAHISSKGLRKNNLEDGLSEYAPYVVMGASQGRRPEFVGGGLITSVGGWLALRSIRSAGLRIFLHLVLHHLEELLERHTVVVPQKE
jgi:hypothetical protein